MHLKSSLVYSSIMATLLTSFSPWSADATPMSHQEDCSAPISAHSFPGNHQESVSANDLARLNQEIELAGGTPLPEGTVQYGFNSRGDAVAIDADGRETILATGDKMDAELDSVKMQTRSTEGQEDKGILSAAAASIAGCVGSVVGYDAILGILEKRVSYWALVKFLGGKVGVGLAISCIAGAGGALATYMGW